MKVDKLTAGIVIISLLALAGSGVAETYLGGGVGVVKPTESPAPVDDGTAVCAVGGPDVGGACIPFGTAGDAAKRASNNVFVLDQAMGTQVAFQVCIDNDQDGACGTPSFLPCGDDLFFSHDDDGTFHNPLGPLPTGLRSGCASQPGAWQGYVVFLCQGVHDAGQGPHVHPATTGSVYRTSGGSGYGDFCGPEEGEETPTLKEYTIVNGA